MVKISTSDFQKGTFIEFRNAIHQIIDFTHVNPGKGSAFIRTKLKNISSGNTLEFTYKSGESVEMLNVHTKELQYLYKNDGIYTFMDPVSFDQLSSEDKILGTFAGYLKEGDIYQLYVHDNLAIGIKIPKKIKLTVSEAEEGAKGNTVSGAKKTVLLETGIRISVPLFIKKGDIVVINPETNEYLERSK